ncbi:MAG: hypothetical protein JWL98_1716 [Xanthomonadaceae bacterium]|nr:hypothetical protein [Xanthomonadaceae bacterium]
MNAGALTDTPTRVALLARPGVACERLQAALQEAGADIVLIADPADSDVAGVRAARAQAILIALEPMVDDALERYDSLLADPGITVIFDEAELAAQRQGWDAARWARHLAAKLNRHQHVLPPGAEIDADIEMTAEMSAPLDVYQRPESNGNLSSFLDEIAVASLDVPEDRPLAAHAPHPFDPTLAEFEPTNEESATSTSGAFSFDINAFEAQAHETTPHAVPDGQIEGDKPALHDPAASTERFRMDLDALELRIADMQLEDVRPSRVASQDGAVLVLAGIGGPDAVRQLLADLPATFSRAVLIKQRLEGARHDNLVRQMQRATTMPVRLAEVGIALERGHVYVLPGDVGLVMQPEGLHFAQGSDGLMASLPSTDSAIVMLSGSDPDSVDAALAHGIRGALVAGQSSEGCFDAAASEALVARGGQSATPAALAKQLAARWPS